MESVSMKPSQLEPFHGPRCKMADCGGNDPASPVLFAEPIAEFAADPFNIGSENHTNGTDSDAFHVYGEHKLFRIFVTRGDCREEALGILHGVRVWKAVPKPLGNFAIIRVVRYRRGIVHPKRAEAAQAAIHCELLHRQNYSIERPVRPSDTESMQKKAWVYFRSRRLVCAPSASLDEPFLMPEYNLLMATAPRPNG